MVTLIHFHSPPADPSELAVVEIGSVINFLIYLFRFSRPFCRWVPDTLFSPTLDTPHTYSMAKHGPACS